MEEVPALNVEKFETPTQEAPKTPEEITAQQEAVNAQNNAILKSAMMNAAIFNMQANQRTAIGDMVANASGEEQDEKVTSKDYDMDLLKAYNVEELNLLETMSLRKSCLKQLNNLKSCQQMLKAVEDLIQLENHPTINRDVMSTNYLEAYGFGDVSLAKFYELFDEFEPALQDLVTKCNARITALREAGVSTVTLTENMVDLLKKKLASLPSGAANYAFESAKLANIIEAYENRGQGLIEYFKKKIMAFETNKKNVRNLKRAANGTASDIAGKLIGNYDKATLSSFIAFCEENQTVDNDQTFGGCMTTNEVIVLLYILNRLFASEAAANNHVWVDLLISTFVDIRSGIFDIDDPYGWMNDFRKAVGKPLISLAIQITDNGVSGQIENFISKSIEFDTKRREDIMKKIEAEQAAKETAETAPSEESGEPTDEVSQESDTAESATEEQSSESDTPAVTETEE